MKKIILFIGLVALLVGCGQSGDMGTKASVMSEDFVKEKLNYPATADFERNNVWEPENEEGTEGVIMKKFTASNTFGVPIQYIYKIYMIYLGGEWTDINNWTYKYMIIEDTASGKQMRFIP